MEVVKPLSFRRHEESGPYVYENSVMIDNYSCCGAVGAYLQPEEATWPQIRSLVKAGIEKRRIEPARARVTVRLGVPAPVYEIAAPYRPHKIYRSANWHTFGGLR
jgi:hypothetical protein